MENGWTRAVLIGVAVAALLAAAGARTFFHLYLVPSQITLINRSNEPVSDARLRQRNEEIALGPIEPGHMRSADFIAREGSLTLAVTFGSGRTVSTDNVGYLAAGIPVTVIFEVSDNKVALLNVVKRNSSPYSNR